MILLLLLLLSGGGGAPAKPTPTAATLAQPIVVASPDVVSGGTLVTLQGMNFRPNDRLMFFLRDPARPTEPILQIGTDQDAMPAGTFIWSFTYPSDPRWTSISSASVIVQSTATGGYLTVPLRVVPSTTIPTIIVPTDRTWRHGRPCRPA